MLALVRRGGMISITPINQQKDGATCQFNAVLAMHPQIFNFFINFKPLFTDCPPVIWNPSRGSCFIFFKDVQNICSVGISEWSPLLIFIHFNQVQRDPHGYNYAPTLVIPYFLYNYAPSINSCPQNIHSHNKKAYSLQCRWN